MNVSIPYKGKLHIKIFEALRQRKRLWHRETSDKRQKWARDLEQHQGYVHESEDDKLRKTNADKTGNQEYTQIVIPYSYGLIMAFHTYLSSVFLARSPVLQFQERHGLSEANVQALEAIMDYQVNIGGHLVPYYIWLMDATKHGLGVVGAYWDSETVRVSKIVDETPTIGGFKFPGVASRRVKRTVEVPGYRGNRIFNIRPQDFIFDPRVSLGCFQEGEFSGRLLDISMIDIQEGKSDGRYINVEHLKKTNRTNSQSIDEHRDTDESVVDLPDPHGDGAGLLGDPKLDIPDTQRVEGFEMFVRLIPKNWGLGKGDRAEKWVFTVVDDVIIEARPLGALHDKFPYGILETEIDGHALFKRSMLEIAEPLNNVLSWLVNTHFFNIRKTLNNMFVADPSRIYTRDFKNPEYGLMIRLRPEAYGTPIDSAIKQFQTTDVTQTHIQDTKIIAELLQQTLGINSQLMGMLTEGGRKTATEVRGSTGFSMNRLKTQAEYMSAMGFAPLSQMMVQNTQQYLDVERKYKLTGDLLPGNAQNIMVSPEAIAGFYDYIPVDGTMPVDKLALANLWKELMMGVGNNEQLMAQYDIGSIFAYTAQLSGAKNISRFKIQTMPDQQVADQAAAGNLIPTGGPNAGPVSAESFARPNGAQGGGIGDAQNRVNEPKQLTGVGPVS